MSRNRTLAPLRIRVPESTIRRLSLYLRRLRELRTEGLSLVTSKDLARETDISPDQVRKDLAIFGSFGTPGRGYDSAGLEGELTRLLGLDRSWGMVLVGAGRLGSALCAYPGFKSQGFEIRAVLDNDPAKLGIPCGRHRILGLEDLDRVVAEAQIELGIIATTAQAAQVVADRLAAAGIRGILNFAPARLEVPSPVVVKTVDLTIELEGLTFHLSRERP